MTLHDVRSHGLVPFTAQIAVAAAGHANEKAGAGFVVVRHRPETVSRHTRDAVANKKRKRGTAENHAPAEPFDREDGPNG